MEPPVTRVDAAGGNGTGHSCTGGAGVRVLDISASHLVERRDAVQPVLLEEAHRLGLPDSAGTAASNPRFDDTEIPVAVVRVHAPGFEPGQTLAFTSCDVNAMSSASPNSRVP
jgi:hypothetical protein